MLQLPEDIQHDVPELWQRHRAWLRERGISAPRVAIHGGYGKNNLGDDAILHVLVTRVLAELPGARLTVICHGPDNVARRHAGAPSLRVCHFRSRAALEAICASDIYIVGGGGIVNRINAYSGRETLRLLDMKGKFVFLAPLFAKLCGAQTHFYAIGVTSFPDSGVRFLARHVLRTADVVSVRDRLSLANLRSLGLDRELSLVLDPALSMQAAPAEEGERLLERWGYLRSARPLVCIGFRYERNPAVDNGAKVQAAVRLARHLIDARAADVIFVPASQHPSLHYEDDLHLGQAVRAALGRESHFFLVEEYAHPTVTMAAFGRADFCIFERLHAVILGNLVGTPVFAIAYDSKVSEFVELIGKAAECMTTERFVAAPDFGWLERAWSRAFAGERPALGA